MAYYTDQRAYFADIVMHGDKKRILFEGDSWFSIPDLGNIPIQFDSRLDLSILCLADPGDTLEELSEGTQLKVLESLIHDNQFGQQWDAIVLSAGGNDVIGPEIKALLKMADDPASTDPDDYLDQAAVAATFALIKKRLNIIRKVRDKSKVNKATPIFIHTYAYLTPRNVAHKVFTWKVSGPWVFPHMVAIGINDCALQQAIVVKLLDGFFDALTDIESESGSNFHVVDTRKALQPVKCSERMSSFEFWRDEIHPTSKGFAQIVQKKFIPALKAQGVV